VNPVFQLKDAPDVYWTLGVALFLGVSFAVFYSWFSRNRALRVIEQWAHEHHFTIVSIRQPAFVPLWKSGKGWQFFRATLRDSAGSMRECWLRCRDLNSDSQKVEVTWK
jgi:hypothetical protein